MSLLEVDGLTTHIKLRSGNVRAVDGVSFRVDAGETVGLVGESGCGKSMTGNSVMQLLPPGGRIVAGSVRLDGTDLVGLPESAMQRVRGNEIGMVFQDPMTSLNPTMTIGRQIAEAVELHRDVTRAAARARAAEVLGLVGMPRPAERLDDYPHQLSGGLRQRVMIAMALACEPRILIADEPTTALDVTIQAQILDLLDSLKEQLGMAVVLITHDMGVIAGRTDRTLVMYAGRIVEEAETQALFDRTRHPYTEALLSSIPTLEMSREALLYSIPGLPPDLIRPPGGCRFAPRCRYAADRCRAEDPVIGGEDPFHPYACFFPRPVGPPVGVGWSPEPGAPAEDGAGSPSPGPRPAGAHGPEGIAAGARLVAIAEPSIAARSNGTGNVLLRLEGVVKEFPVTAGVLRRQVGALKAVAGVDLEIREGETFGLVG
ncbi:MAG: ABC transporter ATP-binding protein, partial [Acidimicrobiales bacterium]